MSVAITPGALGRAVIRETLGRRLRAASLEADNWERIAALAKLRAPSAAWLQPEDFIAGARKWDIRPAALHALADAESKGRGFDDHGRLIILAEPHVFSGLTNHAFDMARPDLSYPRWVKYGRGAKPPGAFAAHPYTFDQDGRWQLILQQAELNFDAAVGAMSAGRFQQLTGSRNPGEGHKALGFATAWDLLRVLSEGEFSQLAILHRFLTVNGLLNAFRRLDWRAIARGYNGSGQVAHYAAAMAVAYAKRSKMDAYR